jgi:hypothetical protein
MKQRVVLPTPAELSLDVPTVVGAQRTRIGSESTHPFPEAKLSGTLEGKFRDAIDGQCGRSGAITSGHTTSSNTARMTDANIAC